MLLLLALNEWEPRKRDHALLTSALTHPRLPNSNHPFSIGTSTEELIGRSGVAPVETRPGSTRPCEQPSRRTRRAMNDTRGSSHAKVRDVSHLEEVVSLKANGLAAASRRGGGRPTPVTSAAIPNSPREPRPRHPERGVWSGPCAPRRWPTPCLALPTPPA